jgi:hypothetical protein
VGPSRISSSGARPSVLIKLDQAFRPVFPGWCRTALNCNPNCNPQIRRSGHIGQDGPSWLIRWANSLVFVRDLCL